MDYHQSNGVFHSGETMESQGESDTCPDDGTNPYGLRWNRPGVDWEAAWSNVKDCYDGTF